MNKVTYLKKSKNFIRKVLKQRRQLARFDKGYVPADASKEVPNIENALPSIVRSDQMQSFLLRKETAIRFLIPVNMKKWHDEFRELLYPHLN